MEIKEILDKNNITQEDFAKYLGMSRVGLNKNINHAKPKQSILDSLKLFVARKRGIEFDIVL